jgi:hypothetical protein
MMPSNSSLWTIPFLGQGPNYRSMRSTLRGNESFHNYCGFQFLPFLGLLTTMFCSSAPTLLLLGPSLAPLVVQFSAAIAVSPQFVWCA